VVDLTGHGAAGARPGRIKWPLEGTADMRSGSPSARCCFDYRDRQTSRDRRPDRRQSAWRPGVNGQPNLPRPTIEPLLAGPQLRHGDEGDEARPCQGKSRAGHRQPSSHRFSGLKDEGRTGAHGDIRGLLCAARLGRRRHGRPRRHAYANTRNNTIRGTFETHLPCAVLRYERARSGRRRRWRGGLGSVRSSPS